MNVCALRRLMTDMEGPSSWTLGAELLGDIRKVAEVSLPAASMEHSSMAPTSALAWVPALTSLNDPERSAHIIQTSPLLSPLLLVVSVLAQQQRS